GARAAHGRPPRAGRRRERAQGVPAHASGRGGTGRHPGDRVAAAHRRSLAILSRVRRLAPFLLAFVAGLVGAIAGFALLDARGAFDDNESSAAAAIVDAVTQPEDLTPVAVTSSAGFDPQRVYKDRAAGVVTISAIVDGQEVSGSGFVISRDGHVMTNAHVITNSPTAARARDVRAATDVFV